MKFKILSLICAMGIAFSCETAKAQVPAACASIITDLAKANTSQAATDALTCVTNIASAVAAPLCSAGCPDGSDNCTSPCQPLCTSTYGAHNVACCLESLAAANVTIPAPVNTVLSPVCGAFTYTVPILGSWCEAIPHATAQQALPYIGYICCNYYTMINNATDVASINSCLGTTNPPFACSSYTNLSSQVCGNTTAAQRTNKEKTK